MLKHGQLDKPRFDVKKKEDKDQQLLTEYEEIV